MKFVKAAKALHKSQPKDLEWKPSQADLDAAVKKAGDKAMANLIQSNGDLSPEEFKKFSDMVGPVSWGFDFAKDGADTSATYIPGIEEDFQLGTTTFTPIENKIKKYLDDHLAEHLQAVPSPMPPPNALEGVSDNDLLAEIHRRKWWSAFEITGWDGWHSPVEITSVISVPIQVGDGLSDLLSKLGKQPG